VFQFWSVGNGVDRDRSTGEGGGDGVENDATMANVGCRFCFHLRVSNTAWVGREVACWQERARVKDWQRGADEGCASFFPLVSLIPPLSPFLRDLGSCPLPLAVVLETARTFTLHFVMHHC